LPGSGRLRRASARSGEGHVARIAGPEPYQTLTSATSTAGFGILRMVRAAAAPVAVLVAGDFGGTNHSVWHLYLVSSEQAAPLWDQSNFIAYAG
jgi:hypothetical protein